MSVTEQHLPSSAYSPPGTSAAEPYLLSWSGCFRVPALIVSLDLQLLWVNAAAETLLAEAKDFARVNNTMVCIDKSQAVELRAFLAGLEDGPGAWIYCRDETAHQMVRAEVVRPKGLAPGACLLIYPVDTENRFFWSDFAKVFGLTRAEATVVKRIMAGEGADAAAEELSVTIDTVRTHIRRIYLKLGVNSREQLFSVISRYRIR